MAVSAMMFTPIGSKLISSPRRANDVLNFSPLLGLKRVVKFVLEYSISFFPEYSSTL